MSRQGTILAPGDVLLLPELLPTASADVYVLLTLADEEAILARAGANEDGDLCATWRRVRVPMVDLARFTVTGWQIRDAGE